MKNSAMLRHDVTTTACFIILIQLSVFQYES